MIMRWKKFLVCYLSVAIVFMGIVPRVYAGFSPSEIVPTPSERASDLDRVQKVLELKMVQEKLKALGFTEEEVTKRLGRLNDDQLHQLALQLDELKAGGDGAAVLIIVLLVAILVGVILYLTGHRIVVTRQ
jgi:hypothetical protein